MQMVGAFAEFERAMIRERTSAGLAAARAEGRIGGRRKKLDDSGAKSQLRICVLGARGRIRRPFYVGTPASWTLIQSSRNWSQRGRISALRWATQWALFQTSTPADRSRSVRAARIATASDPHSTENPAVMRSEGSSW